MWARIPPLLAGWLAGRLIGWLEGGAAGMFAPAAVINAVHAATGAGPATHAKFCFWVRQRFACWRAKFPGRLTSDIPPTAISHCCGLRPCSRAGPTVLALTPTAAPEDAAPARPCRGLLLPDLEQELHAAHGAGRRNENPGRQAHRSSTRAIASFHPT